MDIASSKLRLVLDDIKIDEPKFSTIQNYDSKVSISEIEVRHRLAEQISNPVQWVETMKKLKKYSLNEHLEMGPGSFMASKTK